MTRHKGPVVVDAQAGFLIFRHLVPEGLKNRVHPDLEGDRGGESVVDDRKSSLGLLGHLKDQDLQVHSNLGGCQAYTTRGLQGVDEILDEPLNLRRLELSNGDSIAGPLERG